jgi:hypothetical protein
MTKPKTDILNMKRVLTLVAGLAFALPSFADSSDRWTPIHIKSAELHIEMPKTPVPSSTDLNFQKSYFYTCDAPQGRFVVGFTPIPPEQQSMMHRGIAADPGSKGILTLLSSTVAAFAKGGKARVYGENVGIDKGLPAEFATLKNGSVTLKMRVYLSSRRLYVFVAASDPDSADRFFNSARMPSERNTP